MTNREQWLRRAESTERDSDLRAETERRGAFKPSRSGLSARTAHSPRCIVMTRLRLAQHRSLTSENPGGEEELELMVMTFDRNGLARAIRRAHALASSDSAPNAKDSARTPSGAPH